MYIFKKKIFYILNVFIYDNLYEYKDIDVNISKIYAVCVCLYIYKINI